ncbi:MAG: hypothetical protein V3W41_18895 [Planctomycetota bacterium]
MVGHKTHQLLDIDQGNDEVASFELDEHAKPCLQIHIVMEKVDCIVVEINSLQFPHSNTYSNGRIYFGVILGAPFLSRKSINTQAEIPSPPTAEDFSRQEQSVLRLFQGVHSGLLQSGIVDGLEKSGLDISRLSSLARSGLHTKLTKIS